MSTNPTKDDAMPADQSDMLRKLYARLQAVRAENAQLKKGLCEEPIALIGIGCRLPGAICSQQELLDGLAARQDWVRQRPDERAFFGQDAEAHWQSSLVDGVDQFDAAFFGLTPTEAAEMDPQQRLLLEVAYHALEDAHYPAGQLKGKDVGVFVGISSDDYQAHTIASGIDNSINPYNMLGTARSVAAGRIAYFFDFHGPALQVDTACSSSLMAIHLACQSLRMNESSLALAGGVNLMLSADTYRTRDALGALSASGKCHTFSDQADGYARGEGCAMVLLKPLSAALADQDRIHAVIYASSVNHDGRSNGLTAPNGEAQRRLMSSSLAKAGLRPNDIDYVEAHGTGTRLGDPIEVHAIGDVLALERETPLWLGALKSQLGHLEAAAGVASLIKVSAQLAGQRLLPGQPVQRANPLINWGKYRLALLDTAIDWPRTAARPRYACINSFGLSGTNVNLIVGDAAQAPAQALAMPVPPVLCISGKSRSSYLKNLYRVEQILRTDDDSAALLLNSCLYRDHFAFRHAFPAGNRAELLAALTREKGRLLPMSSVGELAFCFGGALSQPRALFAWLHSRADAFAIVAGAALDTLGMHGQGAQALSGMSDAAAAIVTEYCLARMWQALGVKAELAVAIGPGVRAAAAFCGVLSLSEALGFAPDATLIPAGPTMPLAIERDGHFVVLGAGEAPLAHELLRTGASALAIAPGLADALFWLCAESAAQPIHQYDPRAMFALGRDDDPDPAHYALGHGLCHLYNSGAAIDFGALYRASRAQLGGALPLYQFSTSSLWTHAGQKPTPAAQGAAGLIYETRWMAALLQPAAAFDHLLVLGGAPALLAPALARRITHLASGSGAELAAHLALSDGACDVLDLRLMAPVEMGAFDYVGSLDILEQVAGAVNAVAAAGARYHLMVYGQGLALPLRYAALAGFMRSASHEFPATLRSFSRADAAALPALLAALPTLAHYEHLAAENGQLVVERVQAAPEPLDAGAMSFDAGAVWITGGLGGLGLALARKLVQFGAREIVLTGRRVELDLERTLALAEMRACGASVWVEALDVADDAAVRQFMSRVGVDLPMVGDIVHAAGVSDYSPVATLERGKLDAVCAGKMRGAWNLHRYSLHLKLRSLVLYSSISAVWGSAGMSHYAAANAFLDGLGQFRHRQDLPASIVNWGPWGAVGMAARAAAPDVAAWGLRTLPGERLDDVIRAMFGAPGWHKIVCDLDLPRFQAALESRHRVPLLAPLFGADGTAPAASMRAPAAQGVPFRQMAGRHRLQQIADAVALEVAGLLGRNNGQLARNAPLHAMGIDSLMAIDLTRKLSLLFDAKLPSTLIFDHPTVQAVARHINVSVYGDDEDDDLSEAEQAALRRALKELSADC